jgi:membrane protease YdiL (CAAX protease family)
MSLMLVTFLSEAAFAGLSSAWQSMNLGASVVLFEIVNGLSEELLYRGFYQGELNRVYPRRFALGQTRFGWSVFITAGLFGSAHTLSQVNPFQGRFDFSLLPFVYTGFGGVVYGVAREYFGGILPVALLHGGSNLAIGLYPESWRSSAVAIIAEILAYIFFVGLMQKEKDRGAEPGLPL